MKLFFIALFFTTLSYASSIDRLAYQGRLLQSNGAPIAGPVDLVFKLYKNADVTVQCTQTISSVSLAQGIFNVELTFPNLCAGAVTFKQFLLSCAQNSDMVYIEVTDSTNGNTYDKQALTATTYTQVSLQLAGTIDATQIADGSISNSEFQSLSGVSGNIKTQLVPSGAVMFFNLPSCPSGWSEIIDARGRYIIGLPNGGTLASTVGTALTDQENRVVGQHNHTGTTGIQSANHTHSHDHPSATSSTIGNHTHSYSIYDQVYTSDAGGPYTTKAWVSMSSSAGIDMNSGSYVTFRTHSYTSGSGGSHSHTLNLPSITSAENSVDHTHSFTTDNNGTVAGTNAPYLQLLACQKD